MKNVKLMMVTANGLDTTVHIHEYPNGIQGFLCGAMLDGIDDRTAATSFRGNWKKATCPACLDVVKFFKSL